MRLSIFVTLLMGSAGLILGGPPHIATNAPPDKPFQADIKRMDAVIRPYVEAARKTYPEAKARFLKGLPPRHSFFITTRLRDASGQIEQVFIAVEKIRDHKITGTISSKIVVVKGFRFGESYSCSESELIDWLITRPDGTEEGNFVGKFLDEYQSKAQ